MEEQLQQCDVRGVWKCLKPISGHNNSRPELTRDQEWVNNLNRFFNRFDQTTILRPAHSVQPALSQPQLHPTETSAATSSPSSSRSILASIRPPCGPSTRPLSCRPPTTRQHTHHPLLSFSPSLPPSLANWLSSRPRRQQVLMASAPGSSNPVRNN